MTALLEPGLAPPDEADPAEKPQVSRFRFGVSFAVLLLATGALYLIDLGRSGWANAFYSAATQAGAHSWKAFFFGSSDASNFITVDKPPAALWVTDLSARIFGVNSWSILVPEALMGVGAVALLVLTVRRWSGDAAGLVAGLALAATPVAALMFRFNNPDALLVLLLIASFYAITRALETGHTRWLVLAAVFIGNAFLAKMLQAFLVVPALALGYLALGPATWRRRFVQLVYAGLALAASAGWWLVAVTLIPAADRPYIGGSQNNSIWNLLFGYNGFGRLSGNEAGSVGGGARPGGGGGWGATGLTRLFGSEMGGQISWLLPGALVLLVSGLWLTRHAARSDRSRAGLLLWGGWLAVTGATFSFGAGIIHPYYTVALAPAIAALVGIGGKLSWDARSRAVGRAALSVAIAGSVSWGYLLLDRSPMFHPWLRGVALAVGLLAALTVAVPFGWARRVTVVGLVAGIAAGLAGPAAFAIETASTPHTGAIPSAGPATRGGFGPGPGGAGLRAGRGGAGGFRGGVPPGAGAQGGFGQGGLARGGLARGSGGPAAGGPTAGRPTAGRPAAGGGPGGGGPGGFGGAGSRGGIGGLLNGSESNPILTAALRAGGTTYAWAAATTGSNNAAGYQLASGEPVMAIGGFNGTDPAPSLAAFEKDVSAGRIHYYIASSGFGGGGRGATTSDPAGQISDWVEANFTAASLGGTTTYDLTRPAA